MRRIDDPFAHLMTRAVRLKSGCLVLPNHVEHPHRYATMKAYRRTVKAHRFVYEQVNGRTELYICHTCDYPPCFEISHLFPGTQSDNMLDMYAKGRGYDQTLQTPPHRSGPDSSNWKGGITHDMQAYRAARRVAAKADHG